MERCQPTSTRSHLLAYLSPCSLLGPVLVYPISMHIPLHSCLFILLMKAQLFSCVPKLLLKVLSLKIRKNHEEFECTPLIIPYSDMACFSSYFTRFKKILFILTPHLSLRYPKIFSGRQASNFSCAENSLLPH